MMVYARAAILAFAGGCTVWFVEPGNARAAVSRVEVVAEHDAVAIEKTIDPPAAHRPCAAPNGNGPKHPG